MSNNDLFKSIDEKNKQYSEMILQDAAVISKLADVKDPVKILDLISKIRHRPTWEFAMKNFLNEHIPSATGFRLSERYRSEDDDMSNQDDKPIAFESEFKLPNEKHASSGRICVTGKGSELVRITVTFQANRIAGTGIIHTFKPVPKPDREEWYENYLRLLDSHAKIPMLMRARWELHIQNVDYYKYTKLGAYWRYFIWKLQGSKYWNREDVKHDLTMLAQTRLRVDNENRKAYWDDMNAFKEFFRTIHPTLCDLGIQVCFQSCHGPVVSADSVQNSLDRRFIEGSTFLNRKGCSLSDLC